VSGKDRKARRSDEAVVGRAKERVEAINAAQNRFDIVVSELCEVESKIAALE
jgi:hypothetical protein